MDMVFSRTWGASLFGANLRSYIQLSPNGHCKLLRNSQIRKTPCKYMANGGGHAGYLPKVEAFLQNAKLKAFPHCYELQQDEPVDSPALACAITIGRVDNGSGWRTNDGLTIREWRSQLGGELDDELKCFWCGLPIADDEFLDYDGVITHLTCGYKYSFAIRKKHSELRLKRNPLEYYITPSSALLGLQHFIREIQRLLPDVLPNNAFIWEPTDGNRVIGDFLESMGFQVASSDIFPRDGRVHKADFLKIRCIGCQGIVFNPPFVAFGQKVAWLDHALTYSPLVLALLPDNFKSSHVYEKWKKHLWGWQEMRRLEFEDPYDLKKRKLAMMCNWYCWRNIKRSDKEPFSIKYMPKDSI